ncbi:MAG: tRNA (cytidine(56)-2'-O)-methyltransferase [Thermoplasmata archaeon]|jgi:tRNA (cytidine56-2'-O)-methyltransferase
MSRVEILRLGHRPQRDKRVTTHVCLVARAFGADEVIISTRDENIEKTVNDITSRFGGSFSVKSGVNWKKYIESFNGVKVHLTMYGIPIQDIINEIPRDRDMLVIVGSEKVPGEVYRMVDFNVAITNQPHSEVAALAIFLDRYFGGEELKRKFRGIMRVVPSRDGKNVKVFTREECLNLMRSLGAEDKLINHSTAVADFALKIGRMCNADLPLLECGAILHDIGRIRDNSVSHGITGAAILRSMGYPEDLVNIVKRHVGGGIDQEEAQRLGLPETDLMPETIEEKIVCQADNLISGTRKIKLEDILDYYRKKGLNKSVERIRYLHRYLSDLIGMDLDEL